MKRILRFIRALFKWGGGGFKTVDNQVYTARLLICNNCDLRDGTKCTECGCHLPSKARMETEHCPIDKW